MEHLPGIFAAGLSLYLLFTSMSQIDEVEENFVLPGF